MVSSPDEELITKKLNEGSVVDLIYLDFPIAFDSVKHRFRLAKLSGYGIAPIPNVPNVSSTDEHFKWTSMEPYPKWLRPKVVSPTALS